MLRGARWQAGRRCLAFRNLEEGSPCLGVDAKPPERQHLQYPQKGLPADAVFAVWDCFMFYTTGSFQESEVSDLGELEG